jgi:hypothetical protein
LRETVSETRAIPQVGGWRAALLAPPFFMVYNFSKGNLMKKKQKPLFLKVRLPGIPKTGGAHQPVKGGKYRRSKEKAVSRREIKAEL